MFKKNSSGILQNNQVNKEGEMNKYNNAQQVWDNRVGAAAVRGKNWRLVAYLSLLIAGSSVAGVVYMGSKSSIIPYIVQVDNSTGAILSVAPVAKREKANEQEVEYFIWNVIKKARTLPRDLVVFDQNWKDVYTFLDAASSNKFNDMAIREGYQNKIQTKMTTQLNLKGFNKYSGQDNTYQLRWIEVLYDSEGKIVNDTAYEAFFSLEYKPVTTTTVHVNPLGIVIKDFSISQER